MMSLLNILVTTMLSLSYLVPLTVTLSENRSPGEWVVFSVYKYNPKLWPFGSIFKFKD
jgi:hypothetical protein